MRKLVVALAALGVLVLTAGVAFAGAQITDTQLGPRVGIQSGNPTTGNNTVARYHVGVWCSEGAPVTATVTLKQGTHTETDSDSDVCKGVNVHRRLNDLFYHGFHVGSATVTATFTVPGDTATDSRSVRIIDCTGPDACSP